MTTFASGLRLRLKEKSSPSCALSSWVTKVRMSLVAKMDSTRPAMPPAIDNKMLSASNCRITRMRLAPSASRTLISLCRVAPRASSMLAYIGACDKEHHGHDQHQSRNPGFEADIVCISEEGSVLKDHLQRAVARDVSGGELMNQCIGFRFRLFEGMPGLIRPST